MNRKQNSVHSIAMIDTALWRIRIGTYSPRVKKKPSGNGLMFKASDVLGLSLIITTLLLLGGDVEVNPGPGSSRSNLASTRSKQSTLGADGSLLSSPTTRETGLSESSLTEIKVLLHEMEKNLTANASKENQKMMDAIDNKMSRMEGRINDLLSALDKQKKINDELNKKLQSVQIQLDNLEGQSRRNNLVFFGINREKGETWADCEKSVIDIAKKLNVRIEDNDIERAHRLGAGPNSPIICKFAAYKTRDRLLKARSGLKDLNEKVFINEDFTARVRGIRSKLFEHAKKARDKGDQATVVFDKIRINNVLHQYDTAKDVLVPIRSSTTRPGVSYSMAASQEGSQG